jgi:ribosomal protein S18 acetylase RimI-like enzyme
MTIQNSESTDIDFIFNLYEEGTKYQKTVAIKHWQGFDRNIVEQEIEEKRQWKIIVEGHIACVFATTFDDIHIWGEKNDEPSVYIHRIATNPKFRGPHFVKHIVAWAKKYALEHDKLFIRMDTGSGNDKLNNYYISCGFNYLGVVELGDTQELPVHYRNGGSSLFEIRVEHTV